MHSEWQAMREAVAAQEGITLYKRYSEAEAAHLLKKDVSTLKRWRKAGKRVVRFVNIGGAYHYLGIDIVDALIGKPQWDDTQSEPTSAGSSGLTSAPTPPLGISAGTLTDRLDVKAVAQQILKPPK